MDPKAYRLPTTIVPRRYDIELAADRARIDFEGRVTITLDVRAATRAIELHARDLAIHEAALERPGKALRAVVRIDPVREVATLQFPELVQPGSATLRLAYAGKVGLGMSGLYLSKDGDEACLATQCEATDARAIFPCFDEPSFKARLSWTVTTPRGETALANGPLLDRREDPPTGRVTWIFGPTPPISTYLAAFAIGPFAATPPLAIGSVPLRVWALAGKERLGGYANEFAGRLLPWYESYFGVPYPFEKYDQVAVPSFSFGAMENAGLVVFRASLLLMDPRTASWRQRKQIALVVAHEFAHMWFGNLVTMKWWDDLWLNESFAEWIGHKATDELDPSLEVWHEFKARTNQALATDALATTHAIYHPVATPAEASELFDAITYGKGSSVLRMLEAFLGAEPFRAGLAAYMQAFAESNAAGADLWAHLAKASDRPVEEIMRTWIEQPGHPVVSSDVKETGGKVELELRQERFRSGAGTARTDQTWQVPILVRFADESGVKEVRHLLTRPEERLELPVRGRLKWCVLNGEDGGFYRSDPSDGLLDQLIRSVQELTPDERIGLLRDQWGLVRNGTNPLGRFLGFLDQTISGGDHYGVVEQQVDLLRELERMLELSGDATALAGYRGWVAHSLRAAWRELGPEPKEAEDPGTRQRRQAMLRAMAAIAREPGAVQTALGLAAREMLEPASVDPNLAGIAVGVAAMVGDAAHFDLHRRTLVARREAHAAPQEVDRYLTALAAFRGPELVSRVLQLLDDGTVAKQSIGPILRTMLAEPHAQLQAWEHLKRAWPKLRAELGDPWTAILVEAAGDLPPDMLEDVVAFFDANLKGVARESYARSKERLEERVEFTARVMPELVAWARGEGHG